MANTAIYCSGFLIERIYPIGKGHTKGSPIIILMQVTHM